MTGNHPAGRGLNSEKGKSMKRFLSWRSKPQEFWAKRDEVAARQEPEEKAEVLAKNAEEALIMIFIYLYGTITGSHGFTEEELEAELTSIKSYDEMAIKMLDWIREISNNDQR